MNVELPSIDAWLREGGIVVTANERAARSLVAAFHRRRRAEGLKAWPSPSVQDWNSFLRTAWDARVADGRVVLSPFQEQSLWARIVTGAAPEAAAFAGAAERLAALAMEAHHLLCNYAPQLLRDSSRRGWDQDAGAFSAWLASFNEICRERNFIAASRLPLEMEEFLKDDPTDRAPLLLAGFDRILPAQQAFFAAWSHGDRVHEAPLGDSAARVQFHTAADFSSELTACALWLKRQIAANPHARLLVVTQDARTRNGEIERTFLRYLHADEDPCSSLHLLEFSLGTPLGQVGLARGALLLLRWLSGAIAENELDWIFSAGQFTASPDESRTLLAFVRALRRRGLERPRWMLTEFLRQKPGADLPAEWIARMMNAWQRVQKFAARLETPLAWAEFVPQLLEIAGWPGALPLTSAEFQVLRRWQQAIDQCASLGFDGRRISWNEFLRALERAADETLFASESEDAPILIAGPAESAGLNADAIWFLDAQEETWPAPGATQPFIPLAVQRQANMPHASPKLDWDLAEIMTRRLLASAPEVHFSHAHQSEGVESRPSRIVLQCAGSPQQLPAEFIAPLSAVPLTVDFDDATQLPYPLRELPGGAGPLTTQSRCAFQAFASVRLGATGWDAAEAGLTAPERGMLLHEVLHAIWSGPPGGIRSHAELLQKADGLRSFVTDHVQRVVREKTPVRARECMPARYLNLEATRLVELVVEWLWYESARAPFTVRETELDARPSIAGLTLKVRLDRIDQLNDDSLLVVDYKSGLVSPSSWNLPRPDDVQLPLYAGFALTHSAQRVGGLVFAQIRAGKNKEFLGRMRNAKETLMRGLSSQKAIVNQPLADGDLALWRDYIEQMARDFLAGRADADPRDYPNTCRRCELHTLCRIRENPPQPEEMHGDEDGGESDA